MNPRIYDMVRNMTFLEFNEFLDSGTARSELYEYLQKRNKNVCKRQTTELQIVRGIMRYCMEKFGELPPKEWVIHCAQAIGYDQKNSYYMYRSLIEYEKAEPVTDEYFQWVQNRMLEVPVVLEYIPRSGKRGRPPKLGRRGT